MIEHGDTVFIKSLHQPPISTRAVGISNRKLDVVGICKGIFSGAWKDWYIVRHNAETAIYHESELEIIDPMTKFDAFNVGDKVIMAMVLPDEEIVNRIGSAKNLSFMDNRAVGATGAILAVFPKKNCIYVEVDKKSTLMFFDEAVPYEDDVLETIMNPPTTDWIPMHKWLG